MPSSPKWQFSLKHLLVAVVVISVISGAVAYYSESHLIESHSYPITVDYSKFQPDPIFANFDLNEGKSGRHLSEAIIISFDKRVTNAQLTRSLKERKLRHGTLRELLALSEQHKLAWYEYPLFTLGARPWRDSANQQRVPVLDISGNGSHYFYLGWYGDDWYRQCNFLVFRDSD